MRGKEWSVASELRMPINWVNSNGIDEKIWDGIIDVYSSIFANGQGITRPAFTEFQSVLTPTGGEITFTPTGNKNMPFEVRTKISGHELFLRFKAYISGPTLHSEKGEVFQDKVEKYLESEGLALVPHTDIC
jgi:hypothetical protein